MTANKIIAKVKAHLLAQGEPARHPNNKHVSVYRNAKNQSCAVGCLISDEVAQAWGTDNCDIIAVIIKNHRVPDWMLEHEDLLTRLQRIHDRYALDDNNWDEYINYEFTMLEEKY